MAKSQRKVSPPTPFELLGLRVQKAMSSPGAQLKRNVVIRKEDHEAQEDWDRLMESVIETDEIQVIFHDGGVQISWDEPAGH